MKSKPNSKVQLHNSNQGSCLLFDPKTQPKISNVITNQIQNKGKVDLSHSGLDGLEGIINWGHLV
jgi:hypothetical protein